jgi:hypothetical protein
MRIKRLAPLFIVLGFFIFNPILKIGIATAFAQQEQQQEAPPANEPESKPEEKSEPVPEEKKDSISEEKTELAPEEKQESTPEKPAAE